VQNSQHWVDCYDLFLFFNKKEKEREGKQEARGHKEARAAAETMRNKQHKQKPLMCPCIHYHAGICCLIFTILPATS